jgi:cell division protein FtsB
MMMPEETLKLLKSNQDEIKGLTDRNKELEQMVVELQQQIIKLSNNPMVNSGVVQEKPKSEPDITITI